MVTKSDRPLFEASSLRRELVVRILLQNVLLIVSVALFAAFSIVAALAPATSWPLAVACNAALLAAVLQWCHHGVRTMQIKQYLLQIDPDERGWERWLPAHRPKTLLGSRWMVSTKGVFLGLGLAVAGLAALQAPEFILLPAVLSALVWFATAGFLFTNPKE
jgi:hypothetical protein